MNVAALSFWDLMRALPCGECGAEAGEQCQQGGKPSVMLHRARYDAAKRCLRNEA